MVFISDNNRIKCVVVGDDWVGKTSMLMGYATNRYPTQHVPSVFDNYTGSVKVAGRKIDIDIMDTVEQECSADLQHKSCVDTDVFLVCFSVVQPNSLVNVQEYWMPNIKSVAPEVPVVLVGTQSDLREAEVVLEQLREQGVNYISHEQGHDLARKLGATCYVECSPGVEKNVRRILNQAVAMAIQENVSEKPCTIL